MDHTSHTPFARGSAARPYARRMLAGSDRSAGPEQRAHNQMITVIGSGNPGHLLKCVHLVHEFFHADSAGLHILPSPAVHASTALDIVCGVLEQQQHSHNGIGSALTKLCFAAQAPIVLCEQELELTSLRHLRPRIVHVLVAPLYNDKSELLGTIWLAQVSSALTYSYADTLVLQRMATDLALALKIREYEHEQVAVRARLDAHCVELVGQLGAEKIGRERSEGLLAQTTMALSHQTALMREAHHRVKNTLQLSRSLLVLQARATNQGAAREALLEAAERLQLVTRVHGLLYNRPGDCRNVRVLELLDAVVGSFRQNSRGAEQRIALHSVSDDFELPAAECATLMLILNELVTNAFKHAFPNDLHGSISVELKRENGNLVLRVTDTGVGFETPSQTQHFGLTLVQNLAEQLRGSVTFSDSSRLIGTAVTLTMSDADAHSSLEERGMRDGIVASTVEVAS